MGILGLLNGNVIRYNKIKGGALLWYQLNKAALIFG